MRVSRSRKRKPKRKNARTKSRIRSTSKKMKGGSAPLSEFGNVFSNLGFLTQSALNMFSVPIPTLVGQTSQVPLVTQQFPLIQPLVLD